MKSWDFSDIACLQAEVTKLKSHCDLSLDLTDFAQGKIGKARAFALCGLPAAPSAKICLVSLRHRRKDLGLALADFVGVLDAFIWFD